MSEIRDELKEELMDYLEGWLSDDDYRSPVRDIVARILNPKAFPKIAVVDRDAELPESPYKIYQLAILDDGWVKEVK